MDSETNFTFETCENYEEAKYCVAHSEIPMTNSNYIREFATDKELAQLLIQVESYDEFDEDEDDDGNPYVFGSTVGYLAMDGSVYDDYDEAVEANEEWLKKTAISIKTAKGV